MTSWRRRLPIHTPKYQIDGFSGGMKSMYIETIISGVPAMIHGLRRPMRLLVRSERTPISGSVKTSDRRAKKMMPDMPIRLTPSSA